MENTACIPNERHLTDHKSNEINERLAIIVLDIPGSGGANHQYDIVLQGAPPTHFDGGKDNQVTKIRFQNGPILETGFNGITNEALVAIVIDRMRGFQLGPYKSKENACALTHFEEGLMWLQKRTRDRIARGVEGTHKL